VICPLLVMRAAFFMTDSLFLTLSSYSLLMKMPKLGTTTSQGVAVEPQADAVLIEKATRGTAAK
jgi:hypothetical protein